MGETALRVMRKALGIRTIKKNTKSNLSSYFSKAPPSEPPNDEQLLPSANTCDTIAAKLRTEIAAYVQLVTKDEVLRAEMIWCLKMVKQHWSFNSLTDISALFRLMFPGPIAEKFCLSKTKASYLGLFPYFHDMLMKSLSRDLFLAICFHEALNKVV